MFVRLLCQQFQRHHAPRLWILLILAAVMLTLHATPTLAAPTGVVFTVNRLEDTNDNACTPDHCTLREAITAANAQAGEDTILFNLPNNSVITLVSQLPAIQGVLTIDGSTAENLTLNGNDAVRHLLVPDDASLTLKNLALINGKVINAGGGAISNAGTLYVEQVDFVSNYAFGNAMGGGAILNTGSAQIDNSIFRFNGGAWGGAILPRSTTSVLTVTNSMFQDNSTANGGGAIWNGIGGGVVYISGSTFSSNSAAGDGSGYGATLGTIQTIANSTFVGNSIFNQGALTLKNSTVANSSSYGLGNAAGSSTLYNTILNANTAGNCAGAVVNGGNNIDSGTTCGFGTTSGSMSNTDPKLAYFSYHGDARWTLALRQNSPALDTGSDVICAETTTVNNRDQRGMARPQGAHCDIGAFELAEVACPTPSMQNISGFVDGCFRSSLTDVYRGLQIETIAQQPDGKIIIGGILYPGDNYRYVYLARLNPDGTHDGTLNLSARSLGQVMTIAAQPNGKILIGGAFTSINGVTRNAIARLNMDGTLDLSFTSDLPASTSVNTIVVQADGKILIGTSSGVARLNPNGARDTGFNTTMDTYATVSGITVAVDGKVFIGGQFSTVNSIPRNNIAKLNTDGSLDALFDPGVGPNDKVYEIAVQADGKVLIGGWFTQVDGITRNHMARLVPNGTLDVSFDPAIEVIRGDDEDTWVDSFEIQKDNKIVVVRLQEYTSAAHMLRLNDDGSLDTSFRPMMPFNNEIRDILLQTDGNLLAAGDFTHVDGYARDHIVRLINPLSAKEIKTIPTTLQFPAELQDSLDPAPLTISISNARSTGTFAWSVQTDAEWLQASPAFGNTPVTTQVQARIGGLPAGLHTANLIVTSLDPAVTNTPYTVPVSINIAQRGGGLPFLRVSPASLNFLTDPIAGNPVARSFTIDNLGGGSLAWQATVNSAAQSWLSLDRTSSVAPATVNVAVNINGLAPGNYVGEITVSENSGNSPAYTLNVLLTLQPGPTLNLNTTKLVFTGRKNQENPAPQPLTINNSGAGAFTWQATENVDWLTLDINSGAAPATIQTNANTAGLNVGVYRGQMSVSSATAANSPTNVDTVLGVLTGAILDVKSPLVTFDTILGKNPSDGQLIVRNAGAGNLEWVASEDIPWLSLAQTSGSIQGHNNSTTLQLTVNSAALAIGTYRGQITFTSPNGDASPQTINVILTVASPVKYCNLTNGRINLLEGSRVKLYLENVNVTHNASGCHLSGVLHFNLPQNTNLTANIEADARLDNGTSVFTAEASADMVLEIANLKLKLGKKNIVMRENIGLTLDTSGWDLPLLFGGGSQPFFAQATINLNGFLIAGQQSFDLPNLQWGSFSITKSKGSVSFSSDGNYQIDMSGMIAIVIPGSGNANSNVTLTLDKHGIRTGAVSRFTITGFAGLDLNIEEAQITSDRLSAARAGLKVPGAWGGLSVEVYALEITSSGAVKIGGGSFSLPDIKAGGDAFQLTSLKGKLTSLPGGGYEIQAKGMFGMKGILKGRSCNIWVDVTVRTGAGNTSILTIQSPDGAQSVVSAEQLSTAADGIPTDNMQIDGVQDDTAVDGLSLRQFTLGIRCRPGWPIASTGFFLTGVEGKIQLSSRIESVSLKVWIESKAQVGKEPAISAVPQLTIRPKPFSLDFNSPIYLVGKKTSNAKVHLDQRTFSTEITFDFKVLRGGYGLAAGVDNADKFYLRGSGWGEVYVEKGAILNECISYPAPTWKDPGRWLESCISVPDSSQHLARADAAIDLNGIEVKASIAGYRARAYYNFRSGKISVGRGLLTSMVTSAQIDEARQRWEAMQRGEIVAAALDEGLAFTPDGAIMVTMPVEPSLPTVQAADVNTDYPISVQKDVIFGLVQAPTGTLQLNLITPSGQEILPDSLPGAIHYYQTVSVYETQSVYIVPQAAIGNWRAKVVGDTTNQHFFVLHTSNTLPPTLQNLKLVATGNPNRVEASWQLFAAEPGTRLNLYAQTAPFTATIPYTDADGNLIAETSPLFAGTLIAEIAAPSLAGNHQTQQIDLSKLPTGQYSFWIEAIGTEGGTTRCFIRQDTTDCTRTGVNTVVINLDRSASFPTKWSTVITNEVDIKNGDLLVQWIPNSHPDVDNYRVRVRTTDLLTPTEEVVTEYEIGPVDIAIGSAIVSNIAPGHTYHISVGAQDSVRGRSIWSQEQTVTTPQPEFLISTNATNLQVIAGGNLVSVPLLVDMASDLPYAVALDLDYERLPDGIYATFDTEVMAASTTVAQSTINISASDTLLPGQYVVPIIARSGLLEHSLNLIVTVVATDSTTMKSVYLPLISR